MGAPARRMGGRHRSRLRAQRDCTDHLTPAEAREYRYQISILPVRGFRRRGSERTHETLHMRTCPQQRHREQLPATVSGAAERPRSEPHELVEDHSRVFRDLALGFVKIHVLYHASVQAVYGAKISTELERHGYR